MPSAVPPSFGCAALRDRRPGVRSSAGSLAIGAALYRWRSAPEPTERAVGFAAAALFGPEAPGSIRRRRHPGFHQPPGLSADARRVLVPFIARLRDVGGVCVERHGASSVGPRGGCVRARTPAARVRQSCFRTRRDDVGGLARDPGVRRPLRHGGRRRGLLRAPIRDWQSRPQGPPIDRRARSRRSGGRAGSDTAGKRRSVTDRSHSRNVEPRRVSTRRACRQVPHKPGAVVPGGVVTWRRGWDSNPRSLSTQRFSRAPPSTTRPPLREQM